MNNVPLVFWLIPAASITALAMAWYFFRTMMKEEEGTARMIDIAAHVRKGAMAYLRQQYKVVGIVFAVLAVLFAFMAYVLKVQNPWVPRHKPCLHVWAVVYTQRLRTLVQT